MSFNTCRAFLVCVTFSAQMKTPNPTAKQESGVCNVIGERQGLV